MFNVIDGEYADRSFVVTDYGRNEILSCFVSADSNNNQIDKAVVFNYTTKAFTIRDLPELSHNIEPPNSEWQTGSGIVTK